MFVLIKTNDFYSADNIEGRVQTELYPTYEDAYEVMKNEVVRCLKNDDKRYEKYVNNVLDHCEYTNVFLGEYEARTHRDFGKLNNYWKIIEV